MLTLSNYPNILIYCMAFHIGWCLLIYILLTVFRAPAIWSIHKQLASNSHWQELEKKTTANLKNQFEWPIFFYIGALILIIHPEWMSFDIFITCIIFSIGRVCHSIIHIFMNNIRLRGLVFIINFSAVIYLWGIIFLKITL